MIVSTSSATRMGPRDDQQDNVLVGERFVVVADGVSGSPDSQFAARIAVDTYANVAKRCVGGLADAVIDEILGAPAVVADRLQGRREPGLSTVAFAMCDARDRLWLSHLGDSRLLVVRGDQVVYLSSDHTAAYEATVAGRPFEAVHQHTLTRFLGRGRRFVPSLVCWPARQGDIAFAITDGVHGLVDIGELVALAGTASDPEDLVARTLALAELRQLTDNATCAVMVFATSDDVHTDVGPQP